MMEDVTAAEAGSALAEDSGRLFVTGFDLSGLSSEGGTEQVSVTFAAGSELVCRAEAQVELPKLTGEGGTGADVQPPVQLPEPPAQTQNGIGGGSTSTANPSASSQGISPVIIVGIIAVAGIAIVSGLLVRKRRSAPAASDPVPQEEQRGIYMRLELVRGELAGRRDQQDLELCDELIIGADPACDIVVQSGDASPRHVRLFSVEGAVYVEALDFSGAAQVNGEELQGDRRLRSGDEITVGSTVVRLKF